MIHKHIVAGMIAAQCASLAFGQASKNEIVDLKQVPQRTQFLPDQPWPDDRGVHINAHGGGVMFHAGTYYWFGQHMAPQTLPHVHCYSSTDLYNWKDAGIALQVSDDPMSDVTKGCRLERPKVIYNAATKTFVMWFHLELKGQGYEAARSGVAIAKQVTGPYTYLRSMRPNAGFWPINATEEQKTLKDVEKMKAIKLRDSTNGETPKHNLLARDYTGGQMARDMNLFVDDDGKAYHIFSSEQNSTLHIAELSHDYQSHTGKYARILEHRWNEAPAICKYDGRYWLIASDCSGWKPNAARSAVADSIWGPWKELGNPCIGVNPYNGLGPEKTFGGQSTCILPVNGKPGAFIAMFDIWRPQNHITGGYVWLPMTFEKDRLTITWRDAWDLSVFGK